MRTSGFDAGSIRSPCSYRHRHRHRHRRRHRHCIPTIYPTTNSSEIHRRARVGQGRRNVKRRRNPTRRIVSRRKVAGIHKIVPTQTPKHRHGGRHRTNTPKHRAILAGPQRNIRIQRGGVRIPREATVQGIVRRANMHAHIGIRRTLVRHPHPTKVTTFVESEKAKPKCHRIVVFFLV